MKLYTCSVKVRRVVDGSKLDVLRTPRFYLQCDSRGDAVEQCIDMFTALTVDGDDVYATVFRSVMDLQ